MDAVSPSPPIADLQAVLATHADASKRDWWVRYLKGAAEFRGVSTPTVRREAARRRHEHRGAQAGAGQAPIGSLAPG